MTILVTAATGNVGKQVFKQLVEAGENPRVFVRSAEKAKDICPQGDYQIAVGDVMDLEALRGAMEGVSAVYLAVLDAFQHDFTYLENIITAARENNVQRLVLMSAFKVEELIDMPFIQWHIKSEELLMNCGIDCTILQPDWFMQNFLAYCQNGQLNLTMGECKNSFIDTADIAAAGIAALKDSKHAGKTYMLTGPEALNHHEIAATIAEVTGRSCVYNYIQPEIVRQGLEALGKEKWYIDMYIDITSPMRAGRIQAPTADFESIMGRKPVSFKEFVEANVELFKAACPE